MALNIHRATAQSLDRSSHPSMRAKKPFYSIHGQSKSIATRKQAPPPVIPNPPLFRSPLRNPQWRKTYSNAETI